MQHLAVFNYFGANVFIALECYTTHADLSSAFHWNMHLIFVYLVAEYPTATNVSNPLRCVYLTLNLLRCVSVLVLVFLSVSPMTGVLSR